MNQKESERRQQTGNAGGSRERSANRSAFGRGFVKGAVRHRFVTPTVARRLSIIIAIVLGGITLGIIFYRQPFKLFHYPLSNLGATRSPAGLANVPSIVFFDSSMILSGILMFSISARFGASDVDHLLPKRGLTLLSGVGFFVIIFPYNINDPIHMAGGAALFGGLWGLTVLLLLELRRPIGTLRFTLLQLLLQGTILPYAALVMINLPIKQAFQKPAVLGLMASLRIAMWLGERTGAKRVTTRTPGRLRQG